MYKQTNLSIILNCLYQDEIRYVEEISTIERMYLNPRIEAYTPQQEKTDSFILIRQNPNGAASAFLNSGNNAEFVREASGILKNYEKIHLQTGEFESSILKKMLPIHSSYKYRIMNFEPALFKPVFEPIPTRITPDTDTEDLIILSGGNPERFREEVRYSVLYGFKVDGAWVATGGTCIRSRNYDYLFIETDTLYRNRGFARAILSHVIETLTKENRKPIYAFDPENHPSEKLAQKSGFIPYKDLECLFIGPWKSERGPFDSEALPESSFMT